METSKPCFDLAVINPDIITGPMIHPISKRGTINETNQFAIASFIDGTNTKIEDVRFPFYHFVRSSRIILRIADNIQVDVRDVARAHVDALTNPTAGGSRILLISGLISPQLVVNVIRKHFPALRDRVSIGTPDMALPEGVHPNGWDMRESLKVLNEGCGGQWEYRDLETSVKDAVQSMIDRNVL